MASVLNPTLSVSYVAKSVLVVADHRSSCALLRGQTPSSFALRPAERDTHGQRAQSNPL